MPAEETPRKVAHKELSSKHTRHTTRTQEEDHQTRSPTSNATTLNCALDFPPSVALVTHVFVFIRRNENTLRFGSG